MQCRTLRNLAVAAIIAITALPHQTVASTEPAEERRGQIEVILGVRTIDLDHEFEHDTHPDDSFLPGSGVDGSAGTTDLGLGAFAFLGVGYRHFFWEQISVNADVGALLGGSRDEHQNDNDSRPDASGAFVFSKGHFGMLCSLGAAYHFEHFYVGGDAQLAGVLIESGWDRFNDDDVDDSEFELFPSAGPKVGYSFWRHFAVEGTLQVGESIAGGFNLRAAF